MTEPEWQTRAKDTATGTLEKRHQDAAELDVLLPGILDRAFQGGL